MVDKTLSAVFIISGRRDVRGSSRGGYRDDAADNISHRQPNSSPSWVRLWVVSLVVWSTPRGYLVDSWVKTRIICDPQTPLGPPWGQTLPGGVLSQHAFLASTHPHWISHFSSRACFAEHRPQSFNHWTTKEVPLFSVYWILWQLGPCWPVFVNS